LANSVVVIGVRIHALAGGEAKSNLVSVGNEGMLVLRASAGAQPQDASGQQINDFLVRVSRLIGGRLDRYWFEFVHGKRSGGKRLSC
jgi:hypothetical protein